MFWVDPTDPEVLAAVVGSGDFEPSDELQLDVSRAVALASEILTYATALLVHPAGSRTEEFLGRGVKRLAPIYGPITGVSSLVRVLPDETEQAVPYRRVGSLILLHNQNHNDVPLWRTNWGGLHRETVLRLTYSYASTVTPGAQLIAEHYAHEFFLWLTGNDDDCQLPENVTSIDREGIGIQLETPQDFLDKGRTGLSKVDTWLSQINSRRALRPSGVYTPDSPPGVARWGGGQV